MKRLLLSAAALLALAACSKPTELASDDGGAIPAAERARPQTEEIPLPPDLAPPEDGTAVVDPEVKEAFPDYQPKDTPDTVTDYRSSVGAEINALPDDPAALAQAFLDWKGRAAASPGAFEDGAVMLGADEKEYRPSDAELIAAAAGDKLARAMESAAVDARGAAEAVLLGADARAYKRFTFRHSDVMGSGRYFYASPPKDARIPG